DGRARNGQARGRSNQGGRPVRCETEPGLRDRNRGQGRGHPRPGEEIRRATTEYTEYTEQRQKSEGKNKPLQQDEVPPRLALVSVSFGSFPCIPCIPWLLSWMGLGCPGRTDAHGGESWHRNGRGWNSVCRRRAARPSAAFSAACCAITRSSAT